MREPDILEDIRVIFPGPADYGIYTKNAVWTSGIPRHRVNAMKGIY
jgi:hypothetical protein